MALLGRRQDKLVTGAGIGRAVAETFVREGAAVALLGRRQDKLRRWRLSCLETGP